MFKRHKLLTLVLAVLLLLALALPLAARFQGERSLERAKAIFTAEIGPLELESHRPPKIAPQLNAAHWARAAGEALVLSADERAVLNDVNARPGHDWSAQERDQVATLLAQNRPALDLLHLMAGLRQSSFDLDYSAGRAMQIPNLMTVLDTAELLLAELRIDLAQNRSQDALQTLRSLRSLTRACQRESPMIFQLIGIATEQRMWHGTQELVFAGLDEPAVLVELESPLLELTAAEQLRRAVGFEAATLLATSSEQLIRDLAIENPLLVASAPYLKDAADAQALDYYRRVLTAYPHSSGIALLTDREVSTGTLPGFPASEFKRVFALGSIVERFKALETMRALATLALEARRAALDAGAYPSDLGAFESAAANPYDGEALSWRLEADGGATLEASSASDHWSRLNPSRPERNRPVFRWQLPPI